MSHITLNQYLLDQQQHIKHLTPDLTQLILQVSTACKAISAALHKGALADMLGSAGSDNVQGEVQKTRYRIQCHYGGYLTQWW